MPVDERTVDKMIVDEMTVDEMTVDEMTVDEMTVDEMTCCHEIVFGRIKEEGGRIFTKLPKNFLRSFLRSFLKWKGPITKNNAVLTNLLTTSGTVFTTLHFNHNLRTIPIS